MKLCFDKDSTLVGLDNVEGKCKEFNVAVSENTDEVSDVDNDFAFEEGEDPAEDPEYLALEFVNDLTSPAKVKKLLKHFRASVETKAQLSHLKERNKSLLSLCMKLQTENQALSGAPSLAGTPSRTPPGTPRGKVQDESLMKKSQSNIVSYYSPSIRTRSTDMNQKMPVSYYSCSVWPPDPHGDV